MVKSKNQGINNLRFPLLEKVDKYINDLFTQNHFRTPKYISDNLKHQYRGYQEEALRFYDCVVADREFRYTHQGFEDNHLLFNMATGSGKTDLMAGLILYLYKEFGYQCFLFTVNTNAVIKKTIDNLINQSSDKYLYDRDIEIEGTRIKIEKSINFQKYHRKIVSI